MYVQLDQLKIAFFFFSTIQSVNESANIFLSFSKFLLLLLLHHILLSIQLFCCLSASVLSLSSIQAKHGGSLACSSEVIFCKHSSWNVWPQERTAAVGGIRGWEIGPSGVNNRSLRHRKQLCPSG